ncbi:MAG: MarR family winged helix-turn-helix transcriptional regulator [Pseudonocardiaceae bacterium]
MSSTHSGTGERRPRGPGNAFLLAQLGAHAARCFAQRAAELDLTPPQVGLLRAVSAGPGRSQQELAQHLGTPPTRLVSLVDGLEQRGVLQRRRNTTDRRLYAVYLTDAGDTLLAEIGRMADAHDNAMLAALDDAERAQLHTLLTRIATEQHLTAGVHPGYRTLPTDTKPPRVRS